MRANEPVEEHEDSEESTVSVTITPTAAQLKKFISKPPRSAQSLLLTATADGSAPEPLASWPNDEDMAPALAPEIAATLREYAQAVRLDCTAKLTWHAASGAALGTIKILKAELTRPPSTNFGSEPGELNGTNNSLVIQMQKHLEVMMRAHHQNTNATLHQSRQLTEHAVELANAAASARADAEERADAQRRRADKLQEELDTALTVVQSDDPEDAQTQAHQASIMKLLENPMVQAGILRMFNGGGGVPPATPS